MRSIQDIQNLIRKIGPQSTLAFSRQFYNQAQTDARNACRSIEYGLCDQLQQQIQDCNKNQGHYDVIQTCNRFILEAVEAMVKDKRSYCSSVLCYEDPSWVEPHDNGMSYYAESAPILKERVYTMATNLPDGIQDLYQFERKINENNFANRQVMAQDPRLSGIKQLIKTIGKGSSLGVSRLFYKCAKARARDFCRTKEYQLAETLQNILEEQGSTVSEDQLNKCEAVIKEAVVKLDSEKARFCDGKVSRHATKIPDYYMPKGFVRKDATVGKSVLKQNGGVSIFSKSKDATGINDSCRRDLTVPPLPQ